MLRIIIDVNGKKIGEFHIQNLGVYGNGKGQKRKYKVNYFLEERTINEFFVVHCRENGVEVLMKKVLEKFLKGKQNANTI